MQIESMVNRIYLLLMLSALAIFLAACSTPDPPAEQAESIESAVQEFEEEVAEVSPTAIDPVEDETESVSPAESTRDSGDSGESQASSQDADQTDTSFAGQIPAPEFPPGLDWLNSERPLTLTDLRGKVVLLDFWTYGCINCLHIIPELKLLEEKYADELVVIGVHSAKFENEGETKNIRRIIQRYELHHPVVNDNQFQIWSLYGARAWPTLVIIDPDGNVLGYHSGEGIYDQFDFVIGNMIAEFDASGRIDRTPIEIILKNETLIDSPLLFPGKVHADTDNDRLYIADSNHTRVVVTDLVGNVLDVIGDGRARLQDGDFENASFFRPQGITLDDDNNLYVADTENHAIRRIDLDRRTVDTVAGTGEQVYLRVIEAEGISTPLNSPWDVLYHEGLLYVAMAGQHQIWVLDPQDGTLRVFAGSGREELADGLLSEGGLNQPSGLATDGNVLYIADSEASAIRTAGLEPDGRLETVVGTGLFDFGDVDGVGDEVRLQHPLGIATVDELLYVADTYNSKIKVVNPDSSQSSTAFGGDESGWRDGSDALFDEPGGLSVGDGQLYIADTNNHVIRVADLASGLVSTLVLIDMEGLLTRQPPGADYSGRLVRLDTQTVSPGDGTLSLNISLPEGYKINDLAPFSMDWTVEGEAITFESEVANRRTIDPDFPLTFPVHFVGGQSEITGDLVIYFCELDSQSLCSIERVRVTAPLVVDSDGGTTLSIQHVIEAPVS